MEKHIKDLIRLSKTCVGTLLMHPLKFSDCSIHLPGAEWFGVFPHRSYGQVSGHHGDLPLTAHTDQVEGKQPVFY